MRECTRPDPAEEVQLAIRRLVRDCDYRVLDVSHFEGGALRSASLAGPAGEQLQLVIDRYPLSPDGNSGPWYLFMHSSLGQIPADAQRSPDFHRRVLEFNTRLPHWHFAEHEGQLVLRFCRQANLLDAVEVLQVVEDLEVISSWLTREEAKA
jgi:hypothetical protein